MENNRCKKDTLIPFFFLRAEDKTSCKNHCSNAWRKETARQLSLGDFDKKNFQSNSYLPLVSAFYLITFPPIAALFNPLYKHLGFASSLGLYFLRRDPESCETYINEYICFSPVKLFISVNCQAQPETLRKQR